MYHSVLSTNIIMRVRRKKYYGEVQHAISFILRLSSKITKLVVCSQVQC